VDKPISRNFSSSYLYGKTNYEKNIFNFIMNGDEIDKTSVAFEDVIFDFKKRQISSNLLNVLRDKRVVLKIAGSPLPKAFKVIYARDPRDKNLKVFIDVTDILSFDNGMYSCRSIDLLIAYIISANMQLIYFDTPSRYTSNMSVVSSATGAFADLFVYILDYLRINGISAHKKQMTYLAATYFQYNLLGRPLNNSAKAISLKISSLTEREASIVDMKIDSTELDSIDTFIPAIGRLLGSKELTLEVFIDKWASIFGPGTYFAPELFIAFSSMLTDAYVGCYNNNQRTIEKVAGRNMVAYTNAMLKVEGDIL
jgi:hypothetical protein